MHKLALLCFNGSWYWWYLFKKKLIGSHTQKILKQYQDMGLDVHTGREIKDVWIYTYIHIYIYIGKLYIVYSMYGCVSLLFRTFQLNHKQLNHFNYITFGPLLMFKTIRTIPTLMPWNLHATLPHQIVHTKSLQILFHHPDISLKFHRDVPFPKNTPVQNLSRQSPKMNTGKTKKKRTPLQNLRHFCAPFKKTVGCFKKKNEKNPFPFFWRNGRFPAPARQGEVRSPQATCRGDTHLLLKGEAGEMKNQTWNTRFSFKNIPCFFWGGRFILRFYFLKEIWSRHLSWRENGAGIWWLKFMFISWKQGFKCSN